MHVLVAGTQSAAQLRLALAPAPGMKPTMVWRKVLPTMLVVIPTKILAIFFEVVGRETSRALGARRIRA